MSVTITHYLQPQFLRVLSYGRPMVLLCGNCSLFNIYHKTGSCEIIKANSLLSLMYMCVPINRFVNPFTVQNDLLITFSLCHSSADYKQVPLVVRI